MSGPIPRTAGRLRGGVWLLISIFAASTAFAESRFPVMPPDPEAVVLDREHFPELASGDATSSLQAAIDQVASTNRFGIVFIPSGTYPLSDTVRIWQGVRVIGVGPERPRFILRADSPGYAGPDPKYIIHFVDDYPDPGEAFRDANPGTFSSALSNVVIAIEPVIRLRSAMASLTIPRCCERQSKRTRHCIFRLGTIA